MRSAGGLCHGRDDNGSVTAITVQARGRQIELTLQIDVAESVRTLSATIAAELAEVVFGGAHYTVLFFLGTVLFITTFAINLIGDFAINRMKRKLGVSA